MMKGHTIWFVITRVRYIGDLLYQGEFVWGWTESKGPIIFLLYWKISYSWVSCNRDSSYDYFLYLIRNPDNFLSHFEVA